MAQAGRYVFPVGKLSLPKIHALRKLAGFNHQERISLQLLAALSLFEQVAFVATSDLEIREREKELKERLQSLRDEFDKAEWAGLGFAKGTANSAKHVWEWDRKRPETKEWTTLTRGELAKRLQRAEAASNIFIRMIKKLMPLLLQKNEAFAYAVSPNDAAAAARRMTAPARLQPASPTPPVSTIKLPDAIAVIEDVYEVFGETWDGRSGIALIARGSVVGATKGTICLGATVFRSEGAVVTGSLDPGDWPAGLTAAKSIAPSYFISLEEYPLFLPGVVLSTADNESFRYRVSVLRDLNDKQKAPRKAKERWWELASSEPQLVPTTAARLLGRDTIYAITEEWDQTVDDSPGVWLRLDFEAGASHEDGYIVVGAAFDKQDGTPLRDPSDYYSDDGGPWRQSVGQYTLLDAVLRRGRFPNYRMFVPYESLWAALPTGPWTLQCVVYIFAIDHPAATQIDPWGGWPTVGVKLLARSAPRSWSVTRPALSGLHDAAKWGDVRMLTELLGSGANLNSLDARRRTPLHIAASAGQKTAVEVLLNHGADASRLDKDGRTPLHVAARRGDYDIADMLITAGSAAVDERCRGIVGRDWTALHFAGRSAQMVRVLLARGADVNAAAMDGSTPLHLAAAGGRADVVQTLAAAPGVNINQRDKHKRTALHLAARTGSTDVVNLLLQLGADGELQDENGRRAMDDVAAGAHGA